MHPGALGHLGHDRNRVGASSGRLEATPWSRLKSHRPSLETSWRVGHLRSPSPPATQAAILVQDQVLRRKRTSSM
eukprot:9478972-Pyramimonas_sp.AAC.1